MKPPLKFCLGLLAVFCSGAAFAALPSPKTLLGKFVVSSINGTVTCTSEGRVFELKKGDTVTARGSSIETAPKANLIVVFSNGTGVYADEKTRLEIEKFDQEYFAPNNNLRVEPSNSATVVKLKTGRVVISTPRLLSGTTMFYETAHAAIGIRGDKVLIESNDDQTHVAMIAGNATVSPRDAAGEFISIGKRLVTGQEAFIKFTVATNSAEANGAAADGSPAAGPKAVAANPASAAPADQPAAPAPPALATTETEATIVKLTGNANLRLAGVRGAAAAHEGTKLPRGSILATDDSGEAYVQVFDGTIANLQPKSEMEIAALSVTTNRGTVTRQTALLALQSGMLVSVIDPAKAAVNDYSVRTPQGTATAQGTSFFVSVQVDGFSVGTTADTVRFTSPDGTRYQIAAGQVSITPAGGQPQAPVPLAIAATTDPRFAATVQAAFNAVASVVGQNLGGLAAPSAINLLAKVAGVTAAVLPNEAPAIAARAIAAISTPTSASATQVPVATAAVIRAVVGAAPGRAADIAVAVLAASHAHEITIGAAAARGSPSQAAAIASAVARALLQTDAQGTGRPENLAAVAAAIAAVSHEQAAPVAGATMQALLGVLVNPTPAELGRNAGLIAASVTAAVPSQAVPVVSILMRLLVPQLTTATPQVVAQVGAMLAGAVISVVPPQAQEIATAVMQLIVQGLPTATPAWMAETAGRYAAALVQLVPSQADAILAGISSATGITVAAIQESLSRYADQAGEWVGQIQNLAGLAAVAAGRAGEADGHLNAANRAVNPAAPATGGFAGFGGGRPGGTSITIGDNAGSNNSTSIVISQFNAGLVNQLAADIEAAQAAQTSVQFSVETTGSGNNNNNNGNGNIRSDPVIPRIPPSEYVVSPAR